MKHEKNFFTSSVLVIALCSFATFESPLEKLIAGFKKYLDELPQEKVYLHFDRPNYVSGDTIWFKAYLTAREFHQPSALSHTIYVELINERGHPVKQLKLYSANGSAAGNITLPDSLPSGNYLVRAYTNWMKNGEEDYFFHHPIKIWNVESQPNAVTFWKKPIDIQFFPEGGDLVNGILSKVAVKVIGSDGSGRSIEGKIVDESGAVRCEFKTNRLGMGVFSLLPLKGKSYSVIFEDQTGLKLPLAKESGLVMSVTNPTDSEDVFVKVQATDYSIFKTIYILAQTRGIVCYAARADLSANSLNIKIPKAKFPDGIAQITITDSNGTPLTERLVFINNGEQMNIKITADKLIYKPRERITIQIKATDDELPVVADLSLAVCDDKQVPADDNLETISSYLLLSSELRGIIQSPGYYFNPANEDRAEALDYLLLTQGWRRFSFKKAMKPEWQRPEYKIENGLSIKGRMVYEYNHKPIADGKVSYAAFGIKPDAKVVRTSSIGNFEMNDIVYFGDAKALLKCETKKGNKQIKFMFNNSEFLPVQFPLFQLSKPTENERALIDKSIERKNAEGKTIMLKEVKIVRTRMPAFYTNSNNLYGRGTINERVEGIPYLENLTHPLQILQGRVRGLTVIGSGQTWDILIRGIGSMNLSTTPLIMVDNVHVDINYLNMLSVHDIEGYVAWMGIDATIFGTLGANGVIGFFTKKGEWNPPQTEDGVFAFNQTGYEVEREFYSPKYDLKITEHKKPDKRATLFWAPHIQTDSTGSATISFYNHDAETTVTGIIEGVSATGMPGTATFNYKIKRN